MPPDSSNLISDRSRGGTFRAFAAFGALLALTLVLGVALRALGDAVARDFRHDLAWYRYGAPLALRRQADRWYPWSAPLLERWTHSGDPVRIAYAESTYARLGGWPARRWLDAEVNRNAVLDDGADALFAEPTWRAALGVDDASRRQTIVAAAAAHRSAAALESHFDDELLRQLGVPAPPPAQSAVPTSLRDVVKVIPDVARAKATLFAMPIAQRRALVMREADDATRNRAADTLIAAIASDAAIDRADALSAAAAAHSNGDRRFDAMLRSALNASDLHPIGAVGDYYIALKLAADFPDTRYVRAMKAYDAIRGGTYFGDDRETASGDERAWTGWLRAYPDHPGADDATYWLERALERQAKRVEALSVLSSALMKPVGDGDMYGQLWSRFLYLLDVGAKDADLDGWLAAHHGDPLEQFVAYARGVRYARQHQYSKALELTADLDAGLHRVAGRISLLQRDLPFDTEHVAAALEAQKARWHRLSQWVIYTVNDLHPELRELVIQQYSDSEGWRIPYLALYDGMRQGGGPDVAGAIEPGDLAEDYRHASALATALALTSQNLADTAAGPWTRERDRYRLVALLYAQATQYPDNETVAMHPLPWFGNRAGDDPGLYDPPRDPNAPKPGDPFFGEYTRTAMVQTWYVRQAVAATRALIAEFPNSSFADSALMCVYEMSGERKYLEELLQRYPDGDRAEEARAALYVATHRAPSH